jgi:perosamine synthetase
MARARLKRLPLYSSIGRQEHLNVLRALRSPLSGYLGGYENAGYWCTRLERDWCDQFGVGHSIPCNSATSGLLAACMAAGVKPGDIVWTTPMSMSATSSVARVLGAKVEFKDIEDIRYGINPANLWEPSDVPKALIVTNLFGHPARLKEIQEFCDEWGVVMIEDNAQSILAMEDGVYAGTIGHIGVFSLNVHKHIQCGEGGVIVTDDEALACRLRGAINHGELTGWGYGLNLRMTEITAAIACAQLQKVGGIVARKRALAEEISDMFGCIAGVTPPKADDGCRHSYYVWAGLCATSQIAGNLVDLLNERGVPFRHGYYPLLHDDQSCPVAEDICSRLIIFEVCAYDLNTCHLRKMRKIVGEVMGDMG